MKRNSWTAMAAVILTLIASACATLPPEEVERLRAERAKTIAERARDMRFSIGSLEASGRLAPGGGCDRTGAGSTGCSPQ